MTATTAQEAKHDTGFARFSEYITARTEMFLAEREGRAPTVGRDELANLAEGLEGRWGAGIVARWGQLVASRVRAAHDSKALPDDLQQVLNRSISALHAKFGSSLVESVTTSIDAGVALHQTRTVQSKGAHATGNGEERSSHGDHRKEVSDGLSPTPATYLGVWKSDAEYSRGNMTTMNGQLWHCEGERVTGRPGTSASWRMMHKSLEKSR